MAEPLPATARLTLYRGDTRIWTVSLDPYDLTGHELLAQIRTDKNRTDPVVATIDVDATDPAAGLVTLTLTAAEADKLGPDGARYWWDFQATRVADGFRRTWLAGTVTVKGDASDG